MKKKYPLTSEFLGKKPVKVIGGKGELAGAVLAAVKKMGADVNAYDNVAAGTALRGRRSR